MSKWNNFWNRLGMSVLDVQTRRSDGELRYFESLDDAIEDAKDGEVWKISFDLQNGERVRLVRRPDKTEYAGFVLSRIEDEINESLG